MLCLATSHATLQDPARRAAHLRHLGVPHPPPSNPSSTPLPSLPIEILRQIVQSLDLSYFNETDQKWLDSEGEPWRDLCALASTSRAFLAPARERLYREVTITIKAPSLNRWQAALPPQTFPFDWGRSRVWLPEELLFQSTPRELQCTLAFFPHIANLVKTVVLKIDHFPISAPVRLEQIPARALGGVLRVCRNVERLRAQTNTWEPGRWTSYLQSQETTKILDSITLHPPHLTSFTLLGCPIDSEGTDVVLQILGANPHLKELQLGHNLEWDDFYLEIWLPSAPAFELETLSMGFNSTPLSLANVFLRHSTSSLRYLDIYFTSEALDQLNLHALTNLATLRIASSQPLREPAEAAQVDHATAQHIKDVVRHLPRLKSFEVRLQGQAATYLSALDYLPPSLEVFTVGDHSGMRLAPLVEFLQSKECPLLESVALLFGLLKPDRGMWPTVEAMEKGDLELLRMACRTRSLKLFSKDGEEM